jgi:hypothetical protein
MPAFLTPGVRALQLRLDTPTDTITGTIRQDLGSVKVWYSTVNNFDVLSQGTLAFDGLSLSINIPNLSSNTLYYVKYAFVSAIDPDAYTIKPQLSATVLSSTDIVGSSAIAQFTSTYAIININGVDTDVELRFDRTTGGPASITYNGQTVQCSKPFISQELGINNISATEPVTPFPKQVWLHIT